MHDASEASPYRESLLGRHGSERALEATAGTFQVGNTYDVRRNNGLYTAEVLEKRRNVENAVEYYVHYVGYDKRLDEWVSEDRVLANLHENDHSRFIDTNGTATTRPSHSDDKEQPKKRRRRMDDLETWDDMLRKARQVAPRETDEKEQDGKRPRYALRAASPDALWSTFYPSSSMHNVFTPEALEDAHQKTTKVRNVDTIALGRYDISTWYYSPYPAEYGQHIDKLWICEHCLKYMKYERSLTYHKNACKLKRPPGTLVYSSTNNIYEIDGKDHQLYCQNLSLMAKLFLDHKTVYYDIEGFMFYVLTEPDPRDRHAEVVVGYFSKEKKSVDDYNLACIMILPPYQRQGHGRTLIEFSYYLSRLERKAGSPERPLSDLGLAGYRSYWASAILRILLEAPSDVTTTTTIAALSQQTAIKEEDIIDTIHWLELAKHYNKKDKASTRLGHSVATNDVELRLTREVMLDVVTQRRIQLEPSIDSSKVLLDITSTKGTPV
ncbi:hypothetical protein BZG36_02272 [Bifiguratus adelaidae]|uniref:histone acetyltransferase n=1 Tax=Bifiguratus adelaidae TaxID=1938954 RepID=A0A261XY40_9FUNG|nr:hypothetical protein BZG36_02272 [Bifiguratus adelaidae]